MLCFVQTSICENIYLCFTVLINLLIFFPSVSIGRCVSNLVSSTVQEEGRPWLISPAFVSSQSSDSPPGQTGVIGSLIGDKSDANRRCTDKRWSDRQSRWCIPTSTSGCNSINRHRLLDTRLTDIMRRRRWKTTKGDREDDSDESDSDKWKSVKLRKNPCSCGWNRFRI